MKIRFDKKFKKQYTKLDEKIQSSFSDKLKLFQQDKFAHPLNNHKLNSPYKGCRSINITGDIRAIYYESENVVYFIIIGTHSELYK
jgi:addiction module RelE/StbE family toxin